MYVGSINIVIELSRNTIGRKLIADVGT